MGRPQRKDKEGRRSKQKATSLLQLSPGWQPILSSCPTPNAPILYLQSILTLAFGIHGQGLQHPTCSFPGSRTYTDTHPPSITLHCIS